jgi:uncharacterized protein
MSRTAINLYILFCCLFALGEISFISSAESSGLKEVKIISQKGKTHIFKVEIAETDKQKEKGLMFRRSMPQNQGMLFLFNPPHHIKMWMKNTKISLDILFIDAENKICFIAHKTTPYSLKIITSPKVAKVVLEINGGLSEKLGIKIGDKIEEIHS